MLIKSEEDRNSQANGEGRKASENVPLAKPSGYSCDKIRLPLNKSSNFPTSGIVRQFSIRQQNKTKQNPFKKKERKEFFRMLNLFQLEIILSFKVAELRRLYPFSPRESHKNNQENEKQKHHVFDKTRHLVTSNANI